MLMNQRNAIKNVTGYYFACMLVLIQPNGHLPGINDFVVQQRDNHVDMYTLPYPRNDDLKL